MKGVVKSNRGWIEGAASDNLVTIGHPKLKAPCKRVEDVSLVQDTLASMVATLRKLNGAGLAAPQVGLSLNLVVIEVRRTDVFPDRPETPLLKLINPEIVERSKEQSVDWEGCFSVPGLMGLVSRANWVKVRYVSDSGEEVLTECSGYLARVVQHELDHLSGIEFVDRMDDMSSLTTVKNYLEFHGGPLKN
ncbi:peptide deformylase [Candidatus Saccharibacteria bacterium]|nr:MAG: peptide deformylase [Candidatus Saccharibacteria bacterium]PID99293.1 MAG: peptide deformylase [Candidatus Saccharibacteria bacterium]